jgi:small subunit ribosomal protein S13e
MSSSALPYRRSPPSWCKSTAGEVGLVQWCSVVVVCCPPALVVLHHTADPSRSLSPYSNAAPHSNAPQVTDHICKLARKGMTPSQIGVLLRDSHGIPQVRYVTGTKVLRILKGHGLAPEIPEDLYHLIKKAVSMRKHMERNRKDKDSKFRLILIESRIHRLARYYKVWRARARGAEGVVRLII